MWLYFWQTFLSPISPNEKTSAETNNRIFGLFVRNGDIRIFSSQ